MVEDKRERGRPRTGTIYWARSGWRARITVDVDGVQIKRTYNLQTKNRSAALIKLKRLLVQPDIPSEDEAERFETFEEAAERIVGESDISSKDNRLGRLRNHVYGHFGFKPVNEVTAPDVRDALKAMAKKGLSQDMITHVKVDVSAVLGSLFEDEILKENVCARVSSPKGVTDRRERAVLEDDELAIYLAWEHPDESHRLGVLERQTMACISRLFGGARIGDIRALRWEHLDTQGGRFAAGYALRKKTARPQLLEIPEMLRPVLRDWWERHDRPTSGPVFPILKGKRAGKEKGRNNAAAALRRDLRRAFGIEVMVKTPIVKKDGKRDTRTTWKIARMMTERELELLEESEMTKPVDFHSFRRAYKQALANANVDIQQAMHLSGSSDLKAHQRYLVNTKRMRTLPEAALPRVGILDMRHVQNSDSGSRGQLTRSDEIDYTGASFPKDDGRITQRQSATFTRPQEAAVEAFLPPSTPEAELDKGPESAGSESPCLNSVSKISDPEAALVNALSAATAAGQWDVVTMLAEELRARRLAREGIPSLDAARKRGGAA